MVWNPWEVRGNEHGALELEVVPVLEDERCLCSVFNAGPNFGIDVNDFRGENCEVVFCGRVFLAHRGANADWWNWEGGPDEEFGAAFRGM